MPGCFNVNSIFEDDDTNEEPVDSNYQNYYEIKPIEINKGINDVDDNDIVNSKDDESSGNPSIPMLVFTEIMKPNSREHHWQKH